MNFHDRTPEILMEHVRPPAASRRGDFDRSRVTGRAKSPRKLPASGLLCLLCLAGALGGPAARLPAQDPTAEERAAEEPAAEEPAERPTEGAADDVSPRPVPRDRATPLPWNEGSARRARLPIQQLGGPRELLELYGVDASHIRRFFDGVPLGSDDQESLVRILYRLPRFGLDNVHRWTRPLPSGEVLAADPSAHRIELFRLEGRVRRVERQALLPELAELFDFDGYYRVHLERPDDPHPLLVCALEVPSQWPLDEELDERARVAGLFLKVGEESSQSAPLVFAAHRIAWLPDAPRPEWGITTHHVLLAELGMDVSLLDDVRDRNRKPIGKQDRECFYQMLAAAGRMTPELAERFPADTMDLAPLLLQPEQQHGRLIRCRGTARRITRIVVNDPDIRERFGIDHYFQLDVSLPLGERTIRLGEASDDAPVFTDTFPATFCVLELPPQLQQLADQMAAGELPSETLNEQVRINAFYFKLWAFKSQYISSFDEQQRQIAPMLVAAAPRLVEYNAAMDPWISLLVGGGFVSLLALAWFGIWRFSRSDTRFERTVIGRQFAPEPGQSLDDSGIEARGGPDFSNLDELP